ncbi:MAG: hypothetical protein CBC34_014510 [Hyphomicrobiaceae bacterium TMED74]|nr:MAG: hypothetical protein CBC34_014510 [Hyphomicrobiaceae bacterium TMED74]
MKKTIAVIASAAAMMMIASAPSSAAGMSALKALETGAATSDNLVHKTGRRGRRIAAGIALGIVGAAIATHAYRHHHYRPSRWERRCNCWARKCEWGNDRACYRYDTRC